MSTRCPTCGQSVALSQIVWRAIESGACRVGDIRLLVRKEIEATDREIANALGVLVRSKRVKHVGYGVYASMKEAT